LRSCQRRCKKARCAAAVGAGRAFPPVCVCVSCLVQSSSSSASFSPSFSLLRLLLVLLLLLLLPLLAAAAAAATSSSSSCCCSRQLHYEAKESIAWLARVFRVRRSPSPHVLLLPVVIRDRDP